MKIINPMPAWRELTRSSLAALYPHNRLLTAYAREEALLQAFFAHSPAAPPRPPRARAPRAELAEALVTYQETLGAAEAACVNARRLADPLTPVVTVGQQPGFVGGPLYTLYKALTAVDLAARLTQQWGQPVVPVFWMGSDDDDRAEIDHCGWWDAAGAITSVRYPDDLGTTTALVGDLPVTPALLALLDPVLAGLPAADYVREQLHTTLAASHDFGEWFARQMSALLSADGLVLCDPRLPALRRLAIPLLRRELEEPLASTSLLTTQVHALRAAGIAPPLTKPPDRLNLFLHTGQRTRLRLVDGQFWAGEVPISREALLDRLDETPERFIPNAVLRPLVQEYFFGSSLFVAGPAELAYWAELRPLFAHFDIPMPAVVLRAGATLLTPALTRRLQAWAIDPLALWHTPDAVRQRLLAEATPPDVQHAFQEGYNTVDALIARLTLAAASVDSTLATSAAAVHQRMRHELERLEHKLHKALDRQSAHLEERVTRTRDLLYPGHGLQERLISVWSVLARTGPDGVPQLRRVLAGQEGQHLFVEL
jgi:bacillithiol biosynthesis cysteine-adding enzyme BshC